MSVDTLHTGYAVEGYQDGEGAATVLGGIIRQYCNTGTRVEGELTSGEYYKRFQSIVEQKPVLGFESLAIQDCLDYIGITGKKIAATDNSGLNLYAYKKARGSTRAGAGSHRKYNVKQGIIVPRTLSCQHRGNASISYDALVTYDGSNDPIVITESQSLPSGMVDNERFTLGPCTIGSVALDHLQSLSLDFGVDARTMGGDSDIWDTISYIDGILCVLTLTGIDLTWLKSTNIPLTGKEGTHANTTIYLKKRDEGSTFVANNTAEHIKITAAGVAFIEQAFDINGVDNGMCNLIMPLIYDGTNDPVVFDTASQII